MFDSSYYKNRFVYRFENDEYKAMIELNKSRGEYYIYLPDIEKPGDYAIYLRKLKTRPLNPERIESLEDVLSSHGFTDRDFINPFGRTRKIVNVLDVINKLQKENSKIK